MPLRRPGTGERTSLGLFVALIAALGLILGATLVRAAGDLSYDGALSACLEPHGERDRYRTDLARDGWAEVPAEARAAALDRLADAFLPVMTVIDGGWAENLAHRPEARAFWEEFSRNRAILEQGGAVLMLAGFQNDQGERIVECWKASDTSKEVDTLFELAGPVWRGDGTEMVQLRRPAEGGHPATEIFASRLLPPGPVDPPLAATDGLRTRIVFPYPEET